MAWPPLPQSCSVGCGLVGDLPVWRGLASLPEKPHPPLVWILLVLRGLLDQKHVGSRCARVLVASPWSGSNLPQLPLLRVFFFLNYFSHLMVSGRCHALVPLHPAATSCVLAAASPEEMIPMSNTWARPLCPQHCALPSGSCLGICSKMLCNRSHWEVKGT